MASASKRISKPKIVSGTVMLLLVTRPHQVVTTQKPRKLGPTISTDETWAKLTVNIREIQNHRAYTLSFEENYRLAYHMVVNKQGEMLYNGVNELVAQNLDRLAAEIILPAFPTGLSGDPVHESQEGEMLLKALTKVWEDHTGSMTKLGHILKYMDRIYTKEAKVPEIGEAGRHLFLTHIIRPPIKDHVTAAILSLLRIEREGYTINRSAATGCVDVLLQLTVATDGTTVYKRDLEPAILRESEAFYKAEGERLLETCAAPEYLRRVDARFAEEESRAHQYLSLQTAQPLQQLLQNNLLTPHLWEVINMPNSGLDVMIDLEKFDDLSRLYQLFIMVPDGLLCLRKSLKDSVIRRGMELNEGSMLSQLDDGGGEDEADPTGKGKGKAKARPPNAGAQSLALALNWVQDVLHLKDKFDNIWKNVFQKRPRS